MNRFASIITLLFGSLVFANGAELATPFKEEAFWATALRRAEQGRLHGFMNLEVSNLYVTTHGLVVENQGLVFQPLVSLYSEVYVRPNNLLSSVLLTVGGWASDHTHASGRKPGHLNEADGFAGVTATFARDWKLSLYYSRFYSETDSFPTASELSITLAYDDTARLGRLALHPYFTVTPQLEGKTSVIFRPDHSSRSVECRIGIDPYWQGKRFPLRLELPAFVTFVPGNYYQRSTLETRHVRIFGYEYPYRAYNGAGGDSGAGFASVAMRASLPLRFMPLPGVWTVYASVQYDRLFNPGLLDSNQAIGSGRSPDVFQFHAGLSYLF